MKVCMMSFDVKQIYKFLPIWDTGDQSRWNTKKQQQQKHDI